MIYDTISLEFIGGSLDGGILKAQDAPEFVVEKAGGSWIEVYERQNREPPFFYVQIGYTRKERWN